MLPLSVVFAYQSGTTVSPAHVKAPVHIEPNPQAPFDDIEPAVNAPPTDAALATSIPWHVIPWHVASLLKTTVPETPNPFPQYKEPSTATFPKSSLIFA